MKKVFLLFLGMASLINCSKDDRILQEQTEPRLYRMSVQRTDRVQYLYALELEGEIGSHSFDGEYNHVKKVYYADQSNNNFKYGNQYDLTHENDRVIFRDKSRDDSHSYVTVYYIENGRITSVKTFNSFGHYKNNTPSDGHTNYEYNSEGYLSQKGNYEFIYENGNLSAIKWNGSTQYELKYNNKKRVPYSYFITGPFNSDASIALNPYIHNIFEAVLYEKGLFGKTSKDQLAVVKLKDGKENTFIYEYNNGGGINSITKNSYEGNFKFYFQYK